MRLIPSRVHTWVGLTIAVALLVVPWVLGFAELTAPAWTAWGVGLFILVNEPMTTSPACPAPLQLVPMRLHVVLDVLTGAALAASPWILGFADRDLHVWLPHVLGGALVAVYALATDTADAVQAAGTAGMPPPARQHPGRGRHR